MEFTRFLMSLSPCAPLLLMAVAALLARLGRWQDPTPLWRTVQVFCALGLACAVLSLWRGPADGLRPGLVLATPLGLVLALLVQLLGTVIVAYSARYLQGEAGQDRYLAALATVLAAVHLLLLADHWGLLIAAWALVGWALQHLLCFYPERPFARLAALKKRIADRIADGLLLIAAALAWQTVGSGSLSALSAQVMEQGLSAPLQIAALALVLAVVLRTALLPVHGWLIQVMEAPTPVSALLHAGVVNLGGFVLIRFAPLLEHALPARALLLLLGLASAVLAGLVMLTRVSIKLRLAWSTVAQMGFMLLECALGLYTLTALHLIGHSLYKAQSFLSASTVVRQTRLQSLQPRVTPSALNLTLAPLLTTALVGLMGSLSAHTAWPWWWDGVLGLAWAPLLWLPSAPSGLGARARQVASGLLMVAGLTAAALLAHALPLGLRDTPQTLLGLCALAGMLLLYLGLALLQRRPQALALWRRWSYAGFYLDEAYTRLALRLWPTDWAPEPPRQAPTASPAPPGLRPANPRPLNRRSQR